MLPLHVNVDVYVIVLVLLLRGRLLVHSSVHYWDAEQKILKQIIVDIL